jgi:serine/threonine-protein kinase
LEEHIGHYRILSNLGTGGMGEVVLAHDDQLDRKVAIKRVRQDEVRAHQRERFRREARLAARLNHPNIVHVYDLLSEGEADYLVLEYVEGTTLRAMVRRGPLSVDRAVEFGLQIAKGLQEAHRHGIIHRDLKTENVLVTDEGQAKIADFGIAKRLTEDGADEDSLTRTGAVLGTYRAMSPEQARGEAVDHRSDLFSLGVLLYEILTGQSPFEAENGLAMLDRISRHRQDPVRELNPNVPDRLSDLVDRLLEKEPYLRPRSAGEVASVLESLAWRPSTESGVTTLQDLPGGATLPGLQTAPALPVPPIGSGRSRRAALATAASLLALSFAGGTYLLQRPMEPVSVAVLEPVIQGASQDALDLLPSAVHAAVVRGLLSLEGISPKTSDEVDAVSGNPMQVARAVDADEVVASRLECRAEACAVTLRRLRGEDGAVLWYESFEVPTDDFFLVASAVTGQIQQGYKDHRVRKGYLKLDVDSADLKRFTRLRQRFDSRGETDLGPLLDELAEIRARRPAFLDAFLLEADIARHRFHHTRNPEDLARAFARVEEARRLAPEDPQPLFIQVDVALEGRELDRAEEALRELRTRVPGDVRVVEREARLLKARGRVEEAIALLSSAVRRHPSWKRLATLARMELQSGQIEAARSHLQELLSRAPGNVEGLSLLAQLELGNGSATRAAGLYEEVVRRSPGLSELSNLSVAYFLLGRYAEAARTLERIVEKEPRNAGYALNLADAYALLGNPERAMPVYRRVVDLVEADPAGGSPELLSWKAQALAHLGQGPRAVAAVQEASRLSPDNAGLAYEASVVYAVLGETSSALVSAEKALKLGYEPRWFAFPWFDRLRSLPEFQRLLAGPR